MDSIKLKARAKINLGLDVIRKRDDGYHEVRMVMQTIGIYDRITMTKNVDGKFNITANLPFLAVNENTLMYKAFMLVKNEFKFSGGIDVDLNKFIPIAAGLAGGSTDAAAVIFGLNKLFKLGMTVDEMMGLGVKIGADVPYCIMRGTALAEGIGEKLTRLKAMPDCYIVIAKPPVNVSTRLVYEKFDSIKDVSHPDIDGIIQAINGEDINLVAARMGNVLEDVTVREYPVIDVIKKDMLSMGAVNAMMSGSGPTVFGIFKDKDMACRCKDCLREKADARQVYITEVFNQ